MGQILPTDTCVPLASVQVSGEELRELQRLHDRTYGLVRRYCQHGDPVSRYIVLQHGPLPEKEEDIQVMPRGKGTKQTPKRASEAALFLH